MLEAALDLAPVRARSGISACKRDETTAVASLLRAPARADRRSELRAADRIRCSRPAESPVAALDPLVAAGARSLALACIVAAPEGSPPSKRSASRRSHLHARCRPRAQRAQVHPSGPRRLRGPALRDGADMADQRTKRLATRTLPPASAWRTSLTRIESNKVLVRGYPLDEMMGRVGFADASLSAAGRRAAVPVGEPHDHRHPGRRSVDHGAMPPSTSRVAQRARRRARRCARRSRRAC